jgi:SAM-dependent methyltransferase
MTLAEFEDRYRRDGDPWGYETSAYEAEKYDRTLAACGPGPFPRALELGASIGVLSARLAERCLRLVTLDGAPTAVAAARRRLAARPGVEVRLGTIPQDIPAGPLDLVLASEILYYLEPGALTRTLERIRAVTEPGARLVAVHWRPAGPERPFTAAEVHARLRAQRWLDPVGSDSTDEYLLDVLLRR